MRVRLFTKILMIFIPLAIYYFIFSRYEVYNYWGIQSQAVEYNTPIPRVREYLRDKETAILLGDSRMAHVNMDKVSSISGECYANLAFGGASSKENIDTFWFAVQNGKIQKVVFQVSFYTLNKNYNHDRVSKMKDDFTNPIRYMLNAEYNKAMIKNWYTTITKPSTSDPIATVTAPTSMEDKVVVFEEQTRLIYGACSNYELDYEALQGYIEIAKYCKENSIDLLFVTPPMHRKIWNDVITILDLYDEMVAYKSELSKYANLLDMETSEFPYNDSENFNDPFHFYGDCELETVYLDKIFEVMV